MFARQRHVALRVRVVYPRPGALVSAADSSLVFGTVGSGSAIVTVNGTLIAVGASGGFMGYVAAPSEHAAVYRVVAHEGGDSAVAVIPVRVAAGSAHGGGILNTDEIYPKAPITVRDGDSITVQVPSLLGTLVWVESGGARYPLHRAGADNDQEGDPEALSTVHRGVHWIRQTGQVPAIRQPARLCALLSAQCICMPLPVANIIERSVPLANSVIAPRDTAIAGVWGKIDPSSDFRDSWFLQRGLLLQVLGQEGSLTRVRIARDQMTWVSTADLRVGSSQRRRRVQTGSIPTVIAASDWVDIIIPASGPTPVSVDVQNRSFEIDFADATVESLAVSRNSRTGKHICHE